MSRRGLVVPGACGAEDAHLWRLGPFNSGAGFLPVEGG